MQTVSILMADDDADDRYLMESAFEECQLVNPLYFVKDGVESLVPPNSPHFPNHDRLERGHYFRMGGGVSFALPRQMDLYALVVSTVSGKNVQAFTAVGIGLTWNFKTRKVRQDAPQDDALTGRGLPGKVSTGLADKTF